MREGFFSESPEAMRTRFGCLGAAALGATFAVGVVLLAVFGEFAPAVICVPLGLGVIAVGMIILARHMPQRTQKGSDAVARWRAFKRYLQNLEKYTKVEDATAIFDKYLPYAVAFGLEQNWIRKFARWTRPRRPGGSPTASRGPTMAAARRGVAMLPVARRAMPRRCPVKAAALCRRWKACRKAWAARWQA